MDITLAQFADFNNTAGKTTFSYAELLAQLTKDLPFTPGSNPNIGLGVNIKNQGGEDQTMGDNGRTKVNFRTDGGEPANVTFDDLGFFDAVAGTTAFTIPDVDPPIKRVIGYCAGTLDRGAAGTGLRRIDTSLNNFGSHTGGMALNQNVSNVASNSNQMGLVTGLIPVVAGDFLEFHITLQGAGSSLSWGSYQGGLFVVL